MSWVRCRQQRTPSSSTIFWPLLERNGVRPDRAIDAQVATPTTPSEIIEDAVGPYGVPRNEADWHNENVRRLGRPYQSSTLVIQHRIENLDVAQAKEILERTYVASHYTDHGTSYARVRFAGNGRAVAYWDNDAQAGVTFIGDDVTDLDSLEPPWPAWSMRVDDLLTEMEQRVTAPRSA
jgi:hypothetical protein